MKKIIDVSAFDSPELTNFLNATRDNIAVLTDFSGVETFKRQGIANIQRAFASFLPYTTQVVVLKPTGTVSLLRPRSKGLHGRLIDRDCTAGFDAFARSIAQAHKPRAREIVKQLENKHRKAMTFIQNLTDAAQLLKSDTGIFAVGRAYPSEILAAMRSGAPLPRELGEGIVKHIVQYTGGVMTVLFKHRRPPFSEALYSYPFRYIAAMYCMNLIWTSKGDVTAAPIEKVRNDALDMSYVAYATFFDGLITKDKKLSAAYDLTRELLRTVFHV